MLRLEIPDPLLQEGDELVRLPGVALSALLFGLEGDAPVDRPLFGGDPLLLEAPDGPGLLRDLVDPLFVSLDPVSVSQQTVEAPALIMTSLAESSISSRHTHGNCLILSGHEWRPAIRWTRG